MVNKIPTEWDVCSLSHVLKYCPRPEKVQQDTRYNLIGVRWYANGAHLHDSKLGRELQTQTIYRVKYGDVIYNRMWPTKGAFSIIESDFGDAVATNEYPTFEPSPKLDVQYLKSVMKTERFWTIASSFAKGTTGRARLHQNDFLKLMVAIPPLTEQRKIAAILTSVDDAIAATQRIIDQAKVVKRGLMQQLLTKGIGHTTFKQTEIGEIPSEWTCTKLEDVCQRITYGFTNPMPSTDSGPFMITAKDVVGGKVNYDTARCTDSDAFETQLTQKSKPNIGDVLVTKDGTLGRVALVDRENICVNQSVAVLQIKNHAIEPRFLYHLLQSPDVQLRMIADAGGSAIKHIYITKLALMPIAIPPIEEQKELITILDTLSNRLGLEIEYKKQLEVVKKSIMSSLLTGKVRVDEPSEVLV